MGSLHEEFPLKVGRKSSSVGSTFVLSLLVAVKNLSLLAEGEVYTSASKLWMSHRLSD